MKPLFKSLFRGSRYRKKDLVLLVTTLVIFLYTILPGGWSSSKSQIALQSPVQDGEVDIKNIGKLEGNNKIPKEPPKTFLNPGSSSQSSPSSSADTASKEATKSAITASKSQGESIGSTGSKRSTSPSEGSAEKSGTFTVAAKWSLNSLKSCTASTLNSQFTDFTNSKENYWSSLTEKDKDRYTQEWKDHIKDFDSTSSSHPQSSSSSSSQFIKQAPSLSSQSDSSSPHRRGVIFASHPGALKQTLISIKFLRMQKCDLPVEVWHQDELSNQDKGKLEGLDNVKVFNLKDYGHYSFEREPDGKLFQVKVASFLNSKLDQILFLDSDNTALSDPTFLFDSPAFVETGAIFWKDFWKTHPKNPIWDILGLDCVDEFEQESGQLMIDKTFPGVLRALTLALYLQSHSSVYFRLLLGDKDTFRLSWRALGQPFHLVRPNVNPVGQMDSSKFSGHSMLQYAPFWGPSELYGPAPEGWTDPDDPIPLFMHSNLLKYRVWNVDQPEVLFDKIQRYKGKPVVPDAVGEFDGSTRLFDIDGVNIEVVDMADILPGHEKLYRALYKDS